MNQDNRVLLRVGARELTREEVDHITGGMRTLTTCTFTSPAAVGDEGPNPESC